MGTLKLKWTCKSNVEHWTKEQAIWVMRKKDRAAEAVNLDQFIISAADFSDYKVRPVWEQLGPDPGNRITNAGLLQLVNRLCTADQVWSVSASGSGFTGLGVGTSVTGDQPTDTNLIATGASKFFRACDDGYPQLSTGVLVLKTSYQNAEANFAWNEYGAIVGGDGSSTFSTASASQNMPAGWVLLSRRAPAGLNTKASGVSSLTQTITISST